MKLHKTNKNKLYINSESVDSTTPEYQYNLSFQQWKKRNTPDNFKGFTLKPSNSVQNMVPANFGREKTDSMVSYDSTSKIFTHPVGSF